jgi:predicted  nucleic acid-binding Zn-ribbon protein
MKPATIEQAAEQLVKAKQEKAQAERAKRAAEDKMRRIEGEIKALGIDAGQLGEAIKMLEREIEAELNKSAA